MVRHQCVPFPSGVVHTHGLGGRIWQIFGYGIPACSLAQIRRLESVASTRRSVITAAHRRRRMWLEAAWCLLLPPFMLPLLYIAQGHRYDIYENVGCRIVPTTTWAGLIVTHCFTILIALAVLVYSGEYSVSNPHLRALTRSARNPLVPRSATAIPSHIGGFTNRA